MLALIGIGLDEKDIPVKALEYIEAADSVVMDSYTSIIGKSAVSFIERETGKKVEMKPRSFFEDGARGTVGTAKSTSLAILVVGDPLIATTHHILLDEAAAQGVPSKVFHASSIFSAAIGESRLDIYKFGPTATVPFWSAKYKPTAFIDAISRNAANRQHTLLLLDIDHKSGRPMKISEAIDIISKAQEACGKETITAERRMIVLAGIGTESSKVTLTEFSKAPTLHIPEGTAISLVIPAELSFAEEDAISHLSGHVGGQVPST